MEQLGSEVANMIPSKWDKHATRIRKIKTVVEERAADLYMKTTFILNY
jgi:hypothetical protein